MSKHVKAAYKTLARTMLGRALIDLNMPQRRGSHDPKTTAIRFFRSGNFRSWAVLAGIDPEEFIERIEGRLQRAERENSSAQAHAVEAGQAV